VEILDSFIIIAKSTKSLNQKFKFIQRLLIDIQAKHKFFIKIRFQNLLNRCRLNSLISVDFDEGMEHVWVVFTEFNFEAAEYCLLLFLVVGDYVREFVEKAFLAVVAIYDELVDKCNANNCNDINHKTVNIPNFVKVVLQS